MGFKNTNTSIPFSPSFAVIKLLQKLVKSEEKVKIMNDLQPNESKNYFHIIQTDLLNRSTKNPNWSTISMRCKGTEGEKRRSHRRRWIHRSLRASWAIDRSISSRRPPVIPQITAEWDRQLLLLSPPLSFYRTGRTSEKRLSKLYSIKKNYKSGFFILVTFVCVCV